MKRIQTKKFQLVNRKRLIVSVDLGKEQNMAYYRFPGKRDAKPFAFGNHAKGFEFVWNRICEVKAAHDLEEVVVGFESTGSIGELLVHFFRDKEVDLVQVNPMHTKRLQELPGNSPLKTDRKDPKVIADIMELGHTLRVVVPEGAAADLRRLVHARERAVRRRTALLNQLQELVFLVFPELLRLMKGVTSKTARYLLDHYPRPELVAQCSDLDALVETVRRVSRGKIGSERVVALYEAAGSSIGIREGQSSLVFEIQELLSSLQRLDDFIGRVEAELVVHLDLVPYSRYLLSIKGIGVVTAAALIGEVGDFRLYHAVGEMEKLAGLDLFELSSGKHKGSRRISKRGRPLLRKTLYFAAMNVVRKGGILSAWYQGALDRGMPKTKALVAVSRKILRILFAVVRDQRDYVFDYVNQQGLQMTA